MSTPADYQQQRYKNENGIIIDMSEGMGARSAAEDHTDRTARRKRDNHDGRTFFDPSEGSARSLKRQWRLDNGVGCDTDTGLTDTEYRRREAIETIAELLGFRAEGYIAEEAKRRLLDVDDLRDVSGIQTTFQAAAIVLAVEHKQRVYPSHISWKALCQIPVDPQYRSQKRSGAPIAERECFEELIEEDLGMNKKLVKRAVSDIYSPTVTPYLE